MMKDFDIEEMKDGVREARRALEQKREELREQVERSDAMLTVLDGVAGDYNDIHDNKSVDMK